MAISALHIAKPTAMEGPTVFARPKPRCPSAAAVGRLAAGRTEGLGRVRGDSVPVLPAPVVSHIDGVAGYLAALPDREVPPQGPGGSRNRLRRIESQYEASDRGGLICGGSMTAGTAKRGLNCPRSRTALA